VQGCVFLKVGTVFGSRRGAAEEGMRLVGTGSVVCTVWGVLFGVVCVVQGVLFGVAGLQWS
jgi:hypothetical protein